MKERTGFNFYRSYYDVFNELPEKEALKFIKALLDRQFTGKETDLEGISKFAYISQKHSIDRQIKGFEDKTGVKLTPTEPPCQPPTEHPYVPPCQQEKEKGQEKGQEKEKEKEKEKDIYRSFKHLSISNEEYLKLLEKYSKEEIDQTLDDIENYKNNKKYTSLYLTANKWLKKSQEEKSKAQINNRFYW